ncbi:MAG: hypothetical protein R3F34_14895 [Planctomycetota bacterium]
MTERADTANTKASVGDAAAVVPALLAGAAGVAAWLAVAFTSLRAEAFDDRTYFVAALPLLALVSAAIGYAFPRRAWLWGVCAMAGQATALVATAVLGGDGGASLLVVGLLFLALLALPMALAAAFGGRVRRRVDAHGRAPEGR